MPQKGQKLIDSNASALVAAKKRVQIDEMVWEASKILQVSGKPSMSYTPEQMAKNIMFLVSELSKLELESDCDDWLVSQKSDDIARYCNG